MWDLDDFNAPDSEAMQAEQEIWDAVAEREHDYAPLATEADAHAEWHRNTGVPMGTPGCPQDACHPDDEAERHAVGTGQGQDGYVWAAHALPNLGADECDRCGARRDLYHNEATGMALCDDCDRITVEVEALVTGRAPMHAPPTTVTWKKLRNGAWGIIGPAALLQADEVVIVTKRDGTTKTATVGRVIWTDGAATIASVRR
jgi:hypothetical protein